MKMVPRWSTCETVRNAVPQMWVNCSWCWGWGWLNIEQQQISPQIFLWYCFLTLKGLLNRQSVQFSRSVMVWLFATPWTTVCQASLSITNSRSLLKFMSIELVMPSNHLILCCLLLLPTSIIPSIRVFSNELALHIKWPKYWSFSFNIGPSNEYSGLISFRMDWLDLLAVQGTLKNLHSSKASILWGSAFFRVQL